MKWFAHSRPACYRIIEHNREKINYRKGELAAFTELKAGLQQASDKDLDAAKKMLAYHVARIESNMHADAVALPLVFSCIVCLVTILAASVFGVLSLRVQEVFDFMWDVACMVLLPFAGIYAGLHALTWLCTQRLVYYQHCIQLIDEILASRSQSLRLTVSGIKILGVLRPPRA